MNGIIHATHWDYAHWATRTVYEFDRLGQEVSEAVAVDGVGMASADLHELTMRLGGGEPFDFAEDFLGGDWVAKFINVFH